MNLKADITTKTGRQFIDEVSGQQHAMAGAVIAISAAQAVALGQACARISLEGRRDSLKQHDASRRIEQLAAIKNKLLNWCDRDANAIAEYVALREAGDELRGQQLLCESPAEIARLSVEAAALLQDFRLLVTERVQDDLEMAIALLAGTGRAAILLLDSNLRIWPQPALRGQFEPTLLNLEQILDGLTPLKRIRNDSA